MNRAIYSNRMNVCVCGMTMLLSWFNNRVASSVTFAVIPINCVSFFYWIQIQATKKQNKREKENECEKKSLNSIFVVYTFFGWSTHYIFLHTHVSRWPTCVLFIDSSTRGSQDTKFSIQFTEICGGSHVFAARVDRISREKSTRKYCWCWHTTHKSSRCVDIYPK